MPAEIRITAAIPCGEDQMSQAKILMGLAAARTAFQEAIKAETGMLVAIDMRAVRHKVVAAKPNGAAVAVETVHVSSSDAPHGPGLTPPRPNGEVVRVSSSEAGHG